MPLIMSKEKTASETPHKMTPELELYTCTGWGKCHNRFERVLKKKPDINYKNEDGWTAIHNAAKSGSALMVKRLLEVKADPNVPAGAMLQTALDCAVEKITYEEERDERLNDFDQVMRLDDTSMAIRPNLKGYREVRKLLEEGGGVEGKCLSKEPNVKPDGSVKGGPPSELREYNSADDGTYSKAYHLRSGKYDLVEYNAKAGMLVEGTFDSKTGLWDSESGQVVAA